MPTIRHLWLEIKALADQGVADWGLFALIMLLTLGSFALGRLSALYGARPLVTITQADTIATQVPTMAAGGLLVAAKTGSVYYYPWCTGALKIAAANQRWFTNEKAAQVAGYRPAKNCKGLVSE